MEILSLGCNHVRALFLGLNPEGLAFLALYRLIGAVFHRGPCYHRKCPEIYIHE